jgi:hypothetical protein
VTYLKLKKDGFHVVRNLLDHRAFREWWKSDGKPVRRDMLRRTRARWFFGPQRVRRRLMRAACRVFDRAAPFALELERRLDDMPTLITRIGLAIRRRGYRDLYTVEATRAVIVVPRGVVRNDFAAILTRDLAGSPGAAGFPGLARRLTPALAAEAEELLFESVRRGRDATDSAGTGLLLAVDPDFRWRINGTDGHYYLGLETAPDIALADRRARKRFRSDMEEMLHAQEVFLKRLDGVKRSALAEPFQPV